VKTVVLEQPGSLVRAESGVPVPEPGEALVRMVRMGICGTDLHAYRGDQPFFSYPRVIGHELAGEVVSVNGDDSALAPGDPVVVLPYLGCKTCIACRRGRPNCCADIRVMGVHVDGGLREFLTVPIDHLIPAPDLSWDQRALVECLAIGAHTVRRAAPEPGENVLVLGIGPIGLGVLQFARADGARVIAVDMREDRLAFWRDDLGGEHGILGGEGSAERVKDLCGGDVATCVIDATGSVGSMVSALDLVAHGGRLVYVGLTKETFGWPHPEFHKREATLLASRNATRDDFQRVMGDMRSGAVAPSCLVTHRTDLDGVCGVLPDLLDPKLRAMKALVEF